VRKAWLLGSQTYLRQVRSTSFKVLTLGLPVVVLLSAVAASIVEFGERSTALGYVDETSTLAPVDSVSRRDLVLRMVPYGDREAALAGYRQGEISGFLVIPKGYYEGEPTLLFGDGQPGVRVIYALAAFMRRGMLPDQEDWVYERLEDVSEIEYIQAGTGIAVSEGPQALAYAAMPGLLAVTLVFILFTGITAMGSAAVAEKDQRLLETVLSSMSEGEFLVGKVCAIVGVTLTQLGVWFLGGLLALVVLSANAETAWWRIPLPPTPFVWALLGGVPYILLCAMLAACAGIAAGDTRQAQQLAGLLAVVCLSPIWMLPAVLAEPDGATAVALTVFPLTGPVVALFRMTVTEVPAWQLALCLVGVTGSLVGATLVTARVLRISVLLQGQSVLSRDAWRSALAEMRAG